MECRISTLLLSVPSKLLGLRMVVRACTEARIYDVSSTYYQEHVKSPIVVDCCAVQMGPPRSLSYGAIFHAVIFSLWFNHEA